MLKKLTIRGGVVAAVALAVVVPSALAGMKPVIEMKTANLGKVIATEGRLGIYYWDTEKKAMGHAKCVGACAKKWPPVFVTGAVPNHLSGVMATLGTVKRAGKLQLTVNGLPAYTFKGDSPGVVGCDGVDGWHAVRV